MRNKLGMAVALAAVLTIVGWIGPAPQAISHAPGETMGALSDVVVDGKISPGEYGKGCLAEHGQKVGGILYDFTLCAANDNVNGFYAIVIDDLTPGTPQVDPSLADDGLFLLFDDEHDGNIDCNGGSQDLIGTSGQINFKFDDVFCYSGGQPVIAGDGSVDVTSAVSFDPVKGYVYELSHPLSSGDQTDYDLHYHDTVGFCFEYLDNSNGGGGGDVVDWPTNCANGAPDHFGDVTIVAPWDLSLARLKGLVARCKRCPPDLGNRVDMGIRQSMAGDNGGVTETMEGFIDRTRALMRSGVLPKRTGEALLRKARLVEEQVAAAPPPPPPPTPSPSPTPTPTPSATPTPTPPHR